MIEHESIMQTCRPHVVSSTIIFFLFLTGLLSPISSTAQWIVQNSGTTQDLHGIVAIDLRTAVAVGDSGIILKTTDGGTQWAGKPSGTTNRLNAVAYDPIYEMLYAAGNGVFCWSGDEGETWTSSSVSGDFISLAYNGRNEYLFMGDRNGRVLYTYMPYTNYWWELDFSGGPIVALIVGLGPTGGYSALLATNQWTFGKLGLSATWDSLSNGIGSGDSIMNGDLCYDPEYLVGRREGPSASPFVLRKGVEDTAWQRLDGVLPSGMMPFDIKSAGGFVYVCGSGGKISTSTDHGSTWSQQTTSTAHDLRALSFFDEADGYAVGDSGTILCTGVTTAHMDKHWNLVSLPTLPQDKRKSAVFAMAISGAFAYSNSGYTTRDTLQNSIGYWLKFSNDQAVTFFGEMITTDSIDVVKGWNLVGSITVPVATVNVMSDRPNMISSNFYGYRTRYVVADTIEPGRGYWVKVNQNGKLILSGSPSMLKSNRIRITPSAELPPPLPDQGTQSLTPRTPTSFALFQNSPNPFNPTTVIHYELPINGHVVLKVYNILGEEVATLVNGMQDAGFKSVVWNASAFPSGIYICQLRAGKFLQTRKALLAK